MSLTITYPSLSAVATKAEIDTNFADVTNKFGSIDNSDIAAAAGIDITKLGAYNYETILNFEIHTVAAAQPPELVLAGSANPVQFCAIPGTSADGTYTVVSGSWVCTDVGAQTNDFRLEWGYFSTPGAVWTVATTIGTVNNMTSNSGANNAAGQGAITISSATLTLDAAVQRFVAIVFPNAIEATFMSGVNSYFAATLKLRRTAGLRP